MNIELFYTKTPPNTPTDTPPFQKKYYTNIHSLTDGFGESLKFVILSIMFVEQLSLVDNEVEFHYTPFQPTLEHNYDQDEEFLLKKEKMMRFLEVFPIVQPNKYEYIPLCKFTLLHFFEIFGYNMNSVWFNNCKNIFFEDRIRPRPNKYAAIHIRRMNQLDLTRTSNNILNGCDVPDKIYYEICCLLKEKIPDIELHIFSQGTLQDFDIPVSGLVWHLNEPIEKTFIEMTFADVLVIAPSALSYTAGLYSRSSNIFYIQSYFKPLSHWIPILGYTSTRNVHEFIMRNENDPTKWDRTIFDPILNKLFIYKDENN